MLIILGCIEFQNFNDVMPLCRPAKATFAHHWVEHFCESEGSGVRGCGSLFKVKILPNNLVL